MYSFLKLIFVPYYFFRFGVKVKKYKTNKKQGYLVLANHVNTLDCFMNSLLFNRPVHYMASADLFSLGFPSKIIEYLVAPISKTKSKADLKAVKTTIKAVKNGAMVAIFPEGNRDFYGKLGHIDKSIVSLVRLVKSPLLLLYSTTYANDPRWANKPRRAKNTVVVKKELSTAEIEKLTDDQLFETIIQNIDYNIYNQNVYIKNKHRAEYLERAVYCCPNCNSMQTLKSKNCLISCSQCGKIVFLDSGYKINSYDFKLNFNKLFEWETFQKQQLQNIINNSNNNQIIFVENNVRLWHKPLNKTKRKVLIKGKIISFKNRFEIVSQKDNLTFNFEEIISPCCVGKRKFLFYDKNETCFQFEGDKRFCGKKYLDLVLLATKNK